MPVPELTRKTLEQFGQEHLVAFWDELNESEQRRLLEQIDGIDFPLVQRLIGMRNENSQPAEETSSRAARAQAPETIVRLPQSSDDVVAARQAANAGNELLKAGKVAAILVAGGQGSRLGFDDPKGMFPIGPVSERTLFQILCEQILARSRRAESVIPYFIMTSEATHFPTVAFFEKHRYFGLGEENVYFFRQASLPAIDDESGKILLADKGRVATSPDGHGGMLSALKRHGMLDIMRDRGIAHVYYHQVDNPTAIVCDPALLGHHLQAESDLTTKVVAKVSPEEKMGVLASVDGQNEIIEYSDLSPEEARREQPDGTLVFWAGNTAIHVFSRAFIERIVEDGVGLPFHLAHKKVACVNESGIHYEPDSPNAYKFEQFIFDALPQAKTALVVEGDRAREFNPVKNAEGNDSPATSRAALNQIATDWLEQAGVSVTKGVSVEISPLFALDAQELKEKVTPGQVVQEPTVFE